MRKSAANWQSGRTNRTRNNRTVYAMEKMRHGGRYTTPLEAGNEWDALSELASCERDPEA